MDLALQTRSLPPSVKAMLLAKLREYKNDLNNLKNGVEQITSVNDTQARDELFDSGLTDANMVKDITHSPFAERELMLIKVAADPDARRDVLYIARIFRANIYIKHHALAINVRHHKVGETEKPESYRIKDDLEYSIEIYEWSERSWKPYIANDVQLQFQMMNPYVLRTLTTDKKGLYFTSFKVPDVYGVFQFKIGNTSLSDSKQIPVRPFRHNEYERFITKAFPYYGASFSTM